MPRITPAAGPCGVIVGDCDRSADAPASRKRLREPEVEHLDVAVRRDLDVGGLQVAVDDALLVRRFERLGDLPGDGERLGESGSGPRADAARPASALRRAPCTSARTPSPSSRPWIVRDVRMIQRRRAAAPRARTAPGGRGRSANASRQDLDRDVATELRVASRYTSPMPPAPSAREDLVRAEAGAGGEGQAVMDYMGTRAPCDQSRIEAY